MTDLSTLAGQEKHDSYEASLKAHYAGVKARLIGARPAPPKVVRTQPLSPFNPRRIAAAKLEAAARSRTWYVPPPAPWDEYECPAPARVVLSWEIIVREAAIKHGCRPSEITGQARPRHITLARHEACYRIREELQLSWGQIGRLLGGRDHTTILHGWRMHKARMGQVFSALHGLEGRL